MKHHFLDGIYIKEMDLLKKGQRVETHKHNYDHFGVLGSGEVAVELDGAALVYSGPCVVPILKDVEHTIYALTDVTWFCVHATTETDPERVDAVLIKE